MKYGSPTFLRSDPITCVSHLGLHYGVRRPYGQYGQPGILSYSSTIGGEFQWVQTLSILTRFRNDLGFIFHGQIAGLDMVWPYPKMFDGAHEDSPGGTIDANWGTTWLSRDDEYDTWLEFRPDNGSQWVPLRRMHWGWGGEATVVNNNWVLSAPWDMPNPPDIETEDYPVWTNTYDGSFVWLPGY